MLSLQTSLNTIRLNQRQFQLIDYLVLSLTTFNLIPFPLQTLYHWLSIIVSVLLYFVFALIYNGACVDCMDLNNIPFWVMQARFTAPNVETIPVTISVS